MTEARDQETLKFAIDLCRELQREAVSAELDAGKAMMWTKAISAGGEAQALGYLAMRLGMELAHLEKLT